MAPDVTITDDLAALAAGEAHWGVMTGSSFIEWATPHVERAERVRVLRDLWNREASAGRRRPARARRP
jgi:hypothetical protein